MRRARRAGAWCVAAGVVALLLAGCTVPVPPVTPAPAAWAAQASAAAADLPQHPGPYAGTALLSDGVRPPTNSWVAGPVFGSGLPAYTGILAVTPRRDGFTVGLPRVHATPTTVYGLAEDDLVVTTDSSGLALSALDDLVATWTLSQGGSTVGDLVAAEGWPYVSYTAHAAQEVRIAGAVGTERLRDDLLVVSAGGIRYGVVAGAAALDGFPSLQLDAGESVFVFAAPEAADDTQLDTLRTHAVALDAATVSYALSDSVVTTSYALGTPAGASTLFGGFPGGTFSGAPTGLVYETLYGPVDLLEGTTFSRETAPVREAGSLDLSAVASDDLPALRGQIRSDIAATTFTATDTYGGGKQLYRAAVLYALATSLGMTTEARAIHDALVAQLDDWFDPAGCTDRSDRCFVYDPVLGGIVGMTPSFGSDEFNDHHFHYGYFLAALGMLAAGDPGVVDRYRTVADLLALDIASPVDTAQFPRLRVFDAYRGHSWASGTAPFRDGNNQESVSEAVNAWNGLALWAAASQNSELQDEARWMLSLESEAAQRLWLDPVIPEGFDAPFFAINWGGKRDYATFFDAAPSAILGIELIPMSPAASLPGAARARELIAGVTGSDAGQPLIDYVIMLEATVDPDAAAERAAELPDSSIDAANSRSYLMAWIAVERARTR